MSMAVLLQLLGKPRFNKEGTWLDLPPKQPLLLCAYLVCYENWVERNEIVSLFWPEEQETKGKHNLSQLLYHCKKQVWAQGLETERLRVRWIVNSDVQYLRDALTNENWGKVIELYKGELLEKISIAGAFDYEEWLSSEREALYRIWKDAVLKQVNNLEGQQEYQSVNNLLQQVLQKDFLDENVLQVYMRSLARAGQRQQALKVFTDFENQLKQELDMEPLELTKKLALAIKNNEFASTPVELISSKTNLAQQNPLKVSTHPKIQNLPQRFITFVGREFEIVELSNLLTDPNIRFLTLLGAGGMGKTSLVVQTAANLVSNFAAGVCFVSLEALNSTELLIPTIADALNFNFHNEIAPKDQLLEFLSQKELLLILDNFEHLIAAAQIILDILAAAPKCKILLTSRESLSFQGEYLYELSGLNYPQNANDSLEDYDAIRLFVSSARRVRSDFSLAGNKEFVVQICQLLQGLPLGIELAAAWLRLLSVEEIAKEITESFDLLESNYKNLPERHQSLRAVFEYSWKMLAKKEQETLKQLAIFKGGFSKEAAQVVTRTNLPSLLILVNKSLLKYEPTGHFISLIGVQQFTEQKLAAESTSYKKSLSERHCNYFLALAEEAESELTGKNQEKWLGKLTTEQDNLRVALSWAIVRRELQVGLKLGGALWRFWYMRGHFIEGEKFLTELLQLPTEISQEKDLALRIKVLRGAGVFSEYQNKLTQAEKFYSESLKLSSQIKDAKSEARALNNLANIAYRQRNYPKARTLYEKCLRTFRELVEPWQVAVTLSNLGLLSYKQSDYKSSEVFLLESLELSRSSGNKWMIASSLNNLGNVAQAQGNFSKALEFYQESLARAEELEDKMGIATLLTDLGSIARSQGELVKAEELFDKSLKLRQEIKDKSGTAITLLELGRLSQDKQDYNEANSFYLESLAILKNLGDKHILTQALECYATLMVLKDQASLALCLVGVAKTARAKMGAPLSAIEESYLEGYLEKARANLGSKAKTEFAKGQAMSLEEALRLLENKMLCF